MSYFCQDCNIEIDEQAELDESRKPCRICGSLKRRYEDTLCSNAIIGDIMRTKIYAAGKSRKKGLRSETVDGDSYSVTLGRFVKINQLVDHEAKWYKKNVVDPLTGEILRAVDEPLADHQGRGSAAKKNSF